MLWRSRKLAKLMRHAKRHSNYGTLLCEDHYWRRSNLDRDSPIVHDYIGFVFGTGCTWSVNLCATLVASDSEVSALTSTECSLWTLSSI
jgi:hypothetical protein